MMDGRMAVCPICIGPSRELTGTFRGATDEELFGKIADHVIKVHGGGPVDAFNTAEDAFPWVGARYRRELADGTQQAAPVKH